MQAIKQLPSVFLIALLMLLAGCASPDANSGNISPEAASPPAMASSSTAPVVVEKEAGNNGAPVVAEGIVDRSCKVDSDCAIKDVGNCCGQFPQCVNRESPTFPEQVKAQCAREGRMSVCGFPSISGCTCVQGQCAGVEGAMADQGILQ